MSGSPQFSNQIDIFINPNFEGEFTESWLRVAVEAALNEALPEGEECQVSLLVTSDEAVRDLNRDFRGLDEVTDVLSFSTTHHGHWEGETNPPQEHLDNVQGGEATPFVYPPEEPAPLGEVVISYPQAQRQASERGVSLDREMALLIVHGVLHLAGHDHQQPQEETEMQARERTALATVPQFRTSKQ